MQVVIDNVEYVPLGSSLLQHPDFGDEWMKQALNRELVILSQYWREKWPNTSWNQVAMKEPFFEYLWNMNDELRKKYGLV